MRLLSNRKAGVAVALLILAVSIAHAVWIYPQLPERLASHFNLSGQADGFMKKSSFYGFYSIIMAQLSMLFLGLPFILPMMPNSMINIPNKDLHLSPENRERTLSVLSGQFAWIGAATMAFVGWAMAQALQANLGQGEPALGLSFSVVLAIYVLFVVGWAIRIHFRYRARPG